MIIVTGGAGYIGANLVYKLNEAGIDNIIIIDRLTNKKWENLKQLNFFHYIDVDDNEEIKRMLTYKKITKIYHIGGISSTTETDVRKLMKYNYQSSINWMRYSIIEEIPLVILSSASVYGKSKTFKETDKVNPLNPYAYSKALMENYFLNLNKKYKHSIYIFRPFNVFGGKFETHKLINNQSSPHLKFKQQFEEKGYVELFEGSDEIYRDFIHIDDVVSILLNYTTINKYGIYNLGTGFVTSFYDIAKQITDNIRFIDFPEHLKSQYQFYTKADTTKLFELIGKQYCFKTTID